MTTLQYLLYDVFTSVPFAGNPLAVVIDPPPLTEPQMQAIAREFNLSETVFLTATDAHEGTAAWTTRIFTPTAELPFAGHPTVGAALALRDAGLANTRVVLLEGVGPVTVDIDGAIATLTTATPPRAVDVADPDDIVAALGLAFSDLHPTIGPRGWSAGVPYTMVALRDVETLAGIEIDAQRWAEGVGLTEAAAIYALAPVEGDVRSARWRARMFAPGLGIGEDPATGSAAAAATGFLAAHAGERRLDEGWVIDQGVEMGRPSQITVGVVLAGQELRAATVGGDAVHVGRGELVLPPS